MVVNIKTFDVRFHIVAILLLIFDLEISFSFPWSIMLSAISLVRFLTIITFFIIFAIGFNYEWFKGALKWEKKFDLKVQKKPSIL